MNHSKMVQAQSCSYKVAMTSWNYNLRKSIVAKIHCTWKKAGKESKMYLSLKTLRKKKHKKDAFTFAGLILVEVCLCTCMISQCA